VKEAQSLTSLPDVISTLAQALERLFGRGLLGGLLGTAGSLPDRLAVDLRGDLEYAVVRGAGLPSNPWCR
jgi:hypothetical protein